MKAASGGPFRSGAAPSTILAPAQRGRGVREADGEGAVELLRRVPALRKEVPLSVSVLRTDPPLPHIRGGEDRRVSSAPRPAFAVWPFQRTLLAAGGEVGKRGAMAEPLKLNSMAQLPAPRRRFLAIPSPDTIHTDHDLSENTKRLGKIIMRPAVSKCGRRLRHTRAWSPSPARGESWELRDDPRPPRPR